MLLKQNFIEECQKSQVSKCWIMFVSYWHSCCITTALEGAVIWQDQLLLIRKVHHGQDFWITEMTGHFWKWLDSIMVRFVNCCTPLLSLKLLEGQRKEETSILRQTRQSWTISFLLQQHLQTETFMLYFWNNSHNSICLHQWYDEKSSKEIEKASRCRN